jgi:hypothetical protein
MSTTDLEYTLPTEEVPATWALVTGIPASGYPLAKLGNDNPADPFKVDSQYLSVMTTQPAPVEVAVAAVIHHNFDPGTSNIYLAGGTGGVVKQVMNFPPVPPLDRDGFPVNLLLDLRPYGPLPVYDQWWFVSSPGWGAWVPNSVPLSIGELKLYTAVHALDGSLVIDLQPVETEHYPIIDHATEGDVALIYPYGTRHRYLRGGVLQMGDAAVALQQWYRTTRGRALPSLVLVTEAEGAAIVEPWLCRFEHPALDRRFTYGSVGSTFALELEEISRGLRPTPMPSNLSATGKVLYVV